ncbi:MAG: hypothetical protein WC627_12805, partial [Legionella sp.]
RPAACPRDPGNLNKSETGRINQDLTGSRGQAAGRREQNCQQTLKFRLFFSQIFNFFGCA